ncbi:hypothetical protein D3C79_718250 [compost metagenome]
MARHRPVGDRCLGQACEVTCYLLPKCWQIHAAGNHEGGIVWLVPCAIPGTEGLQLDVAKVGRVAESRGSVGAGPVCQSAMPIEGLLIRLDIELEPAFVLDRLDFPVHFGLSEGRAVHGVGHDFQCDWQAGSR